MGPPRTVTKGPDSIVIYTDGACKGNPGPGGWGALLQWRDHTREICGGERHTTNNRMELTAAIRALQALKRPSRVILHTDSQYLKNGITSWIRRWRTNGWITADKTPVAQGSRRQVVIVTACRSKPGGPMKTKAPCPALPRPGRGGPW